MIDLYVRLHREEQAARRAAGLKSSNMGAPLGLAVGCGVTITGFAAIFLVLGYIEWVFS